jgi:hypothetical protein|tara:strand:+ start:4704 stop:4847 length:144 start_codon:yes stop_codon:yes gene_type:complete
MAVSELEKKPDSKTSKAKMENKISGDTLFNGGTLFAIWSDMLKKMNG